MSPTIHGKQVAKRPISREPRASEYQNQEANDFSTNWKFEQSRKLGARGVLALSAARPKTALTGSMSCLASLQKKVMVAKTLSARTL
jgi:hypothetical protein